jgi:hypothetical protein
MVSGLNQGGDSRLRRLRAVAIILLSMALTSCSTARWWWDRPPPPRPTPVHYVTVNGVRSGDVRQFWDRNALKLDLSSLDGEGSVTVTPVATVGWPIRLEFLVRPGSFTRLEVLAAQRVVFDVPIKGRVQVLKLDPAVVEPKTALITLRWSAVDDSPH